jgi:hypothetical protein
MTAWQVIELAKKPAGYADHKPPYDFKHGWVPVSGAAQSAVTKERELPPLLKQKPAWQSQEAYDAQVANYFEKFPEGWKPDPAPDLEPPAPKEKPATKKPAARSTKTKGSSGGPTPKQQESLDSEPAKSIALRSELKDEYRSATSSRGVSNEESMAIEEWQNGTDPSTGEETYVELNDFLRHGKLPVADFDDDEEYDPDDDFDDDDAFSGGGNFIDRDFLENMDRKLRSALSKTKTTRAMTLFRGLRDGRPPLAVGDTITDKGYSSLTYDPSIARGFTEAGGPESKILVIQAPKGSPLLQVPDDFELELLAGPETPFRITKIEGIYVHVELMIK